MTFDGFLMQLAKVDNHDICAQYGMCPSEGLTAAAIDDSFVSLSFETFRIQQLFLQTFKQSSSDVSRDGV